jgi:hypothetical protein
MYDAETASSTAELDAEDPWETEAGTDGEAHGPDDERPDSNEESSEDDEEEDDGWAFGEFEGVDPDSEEGD